MAIKLHIQECLSEETKIFMRDVMRELNSRKSIKNIDLGAMRMLATSYEMYVQATNILLKEGCIVQIKYERAMNPAQNVATKNYAQVIKIMTEYGLTLKSRQSIKELRSGDENATPIDEYLRKRAVVIGKQ
jgi:P27 family predicted phage terminase small subunit